MTSWVGRTALVTGAASGIGAAITQELRTRGATVTATDLSAAASVYDSAGDAADVRDLDVRDLDAFRAVLAGTEVPDVLFANAGISMGGPTHELSRAHWDRILDVNVNGVVNAVLATYPAMVERGSGHIVITASGAGLAAPPFVTAYATSTQLSDLRSAYGPKLPCTESG